MRARRLRRFAASLELVLLRISIGVPAEKKSVRWTVFLPNKYEDLMPSEMRRLRDLEDENNRLKRIVADLTLEREML